MWKKISALVIVTLVLLYFIPPVNKLDTHPFYADTSGTAVIAHGSGQGLRPNNTLEAAQLSNQLGAVIELDLHSSKDGHLIVRHDATVDATTNGSGLLKEKTLSELKELDAGFRHDPDGNEKYSFRGIGIQIPTLQEVIEGTPRGRYVMELKQVEPDISVQLCQQLRDNKIEQSTIVASFKDEALEKFRTACPEVATSMSSNEARTFILMQKIGLSHLVPVKANAMQVPPQNSGITVLTDSFLQDAKARGLKVDVWTINDKDQMAQLIDMGVDGIITDYPNRLKELL
ncbi:glycerophosphodiester phosphodiesterase [Endozoicomonas arenosclerae]|uniref:glycerophosphodiester phosphodiesterase n=1 Tax=Endozoicomonas arenosclerae TaxID=1633495 RepID=UPI0007862AA5|nr:glycerophosphodiester phosphodiesterase [Endozoicomonas arenosclerae]